MAAIKSNEWTFEELIGRVSYNQDILKNTFEVVYKKGSYTDENLYKVLNHRYLQFISSSLLISADEARYNWVQISIECEDEHLSKRTDKNIEKGIEIMNDNKEIVLISFREGMKTPNEDTYVPKCLTFFHHQRTKWVKFLGGCGEDLPITIEECVAGVKAMEIEAAKYGRRTYADIIKGGPYEGILQITFGVVVDAKTDDVKKIERLLDGLKLEGLRTLITVNERSNKNCLSTSIKCVDQLQHQTTRTQDKIKEGVKIMNFNRQIVIKSVHAAMIPGSNGNCVHPCLEALETERENWAKYLGGCSEVLPTQITKCVEGVPDLKREVENTGATGSSTGRTYNAVIEGIINKCKTQASQSKETEKAGKIAQCDKLSMDLKASFGVQAIARYQGTEFLIDLFVAACAPIGLENLINGKCDRNLLGHVKCEAGSQASMESISSGLKIMESNQKAVVNAVSLGLDEQEEKLYVPSCLEAFEKERKKWANYLGGCDTDLPKTIQDCYMEDSRAVVTSRDQDKTYTVGKIDFTLPDAHIIELPDETDIGTNGRKLLLKS